MCLISDFKDVIFGKDFRIFVSNICMLEYIIFTPTPLMRNLCMLNIYLIFSNADTSEETEESDIGGVSNVADHVHQDYDFEPHRDNDKSEESLEKNDGRGRFYLGVQTAYRFSKV